MDWGATTPIGRLGKLGLACFVLVLLAVGFMVEYRSAFLSRRMGDLDVFLRAAWAVRNDADIYRVTSDNDWHYLYPPLYAILMTPLADPPRDADPAGYLPYALSVGIFFGINVFCLFAAAHVLASAVEVRADDVGFQSQPRFCRRWWCLRLWPIVVCFLPIGHTMMRGQVNLIVLAALCCALAGWLRGQGFRAGLWLSLAICIKVIPAYLLVYPLWKRDGRALLGCGAGCIAGLLLIPGLVFGPTRMGSHYETYGEVFFGPLFHFNDDDLVKEEFHGVNATDSVGVKNAIHNWTYTDARRRPEDMHIAGKAVYLLLGFAMTGLTLWPRRHRAVDVMQQFAGLIALMTIFSPVSHSHYYLFFAPLVMGLLAAAWQHQPTLRMPPGLAAMFVAFFTTMAIAYLPGLEILKDRCATLFAALPLWGIAVVQIWRSPSTVPQTSTDVTATESRLAA